MRLKVTYERSGPADTVDLLITVEPTVPVGELARQLAAADPRQHPPGGTSRGAVPAPGPTGTAAGRPPHEVTPREVTLRVIGDPACIHDGAERVVAPTTELARSGLRSGLRVGLAIAGPGASTTARAGSPPAPVSPSAGSPGSPSAPTSNEAPAVAATLIVEAGPDNGKRFALHAGSNFVGRGADNDVALSDPLVSKHHARIDVTDVVEIVDRGSVNGVSVGERPVPRAMLGSNDRVVLGDTSLRVVAHALGSIADGGTVVAFNRSPRLDPVHPEATVAAPEAPTTPQRNRIPLVALLAPILMGAVLYAITKQITSIIFIALSPVMLVGNALEHRLVGGRSYRRALEAFRSALAALDAELSARGDIERVARQHEQPALADVLSAERNREPLLWTRRPDRHGFLVLRLGLGRQPSRTTVELPRLQGVDPDVAAELLDVRDRHAWVAPVPVIADLRTCRNLGVAGTRQGALPVARAMVTQLVGMHSPAELVLSAIVAPGSVSDWAWLRWLPHVTSEHTPIAVDHLASSEAASAALVAALDELVSTRTSGLGPSSGGGSGNAGSSIPIPIVIAVIDGAPVERSRLVSLAETGPTVGVHLVWVAPSVEGLPAACEVYSWIDPVDGHGEVGRIADGGLTLPVAVDMLDLDAAERFARGLAPVIDAGARIVDDSDIPRSVSLVTLLEGSLTHDASEVLDRWRQSHSLPAGAAAVGVPGSSSDGRPRDTGLRATIGLGATPEPITIDLRAHGPHALVGGTTGSGKSEFLQSWVAALAASYSPARVTFLFVDYKGGAAFRDCVELPHCVGLVTDLTPHLVRRALVSLNAELRHREHLLERRGAKDIFELERAGDPETPPSLVIVVDEFAALVNEIPEFVDGVVNVAQRGRSLGLHLILATQRPAGVIRENLRANTNLRIALRMADEDDSDNVVGVKDAAAFDPAVPGRVIAKLGPSQLIRFQSGYVGGVTSAEPGPAVVGFEELGFGIGARWKAPETAAAKPVPGSVPPVPPGAPGEEPVSSDLRRLVDTVQRAFAQTGIETPRPPWRKELPAIYALEKAQPTRTDAQLVYGILDLPHEQRQAAAVFAPDRDANLAVLGTVGSGKTTLLRTLAVSAGLTSRGGPCHVYAVDFGSRGLAMIEPLPHVGAVISGDDHERLTRLLRWLRTTIDERGDRYAASKAGSIVEYRQLAAHPDEPRILFLLDGMGAFRSAYETGDRLRWQDLLTAIASDGPRVGVHVVVTADRAAAISASLSSAIQRRVVQRMASEQDLMLAGAPTDAFEAETPPGRGFLDGQELQVCVLGGSPSAQSQGAAIERLGREIRRTLPRSAPHPIGRLTARVALGELPSRVGSRPVLGVADETLEATGWVPEGPILVTGPPGSGRSATAATLALSYSRFFPGAALVLLANRRSPLWSLPGWTDRADGSEEIADLVGRVVAKIQASESAPPMIVVVENVADLVGTPADQPLQELTRLCQRRAIPLVAEIEVSGAGGFGSLVQGLRSVRHGIALQPDQADGDQIFKTAFPRLQRGEFPPGRGFYVRQGRIERVQVALPEA